VTENFTTDMRGRSQELSETVSAALEGREMWSFLDKIRLL